MFHGLMAYSATNGITGLIQKANSCISAEVCTSDKPIGQIGLFVTGRHTRAFICDIWSTYDDNSRKASFDYLSSGIHSTLEANELIVDKNLLTYLRKYRSNNYCELFTVVETIDAVWIKDTASILNKKRARVLGRALKLPVITVSNDSDALNWR